MLRVLGFHKIQRFSLGGTWNTPGQIETFFQTLQASGFDLVSLKQLVRDPLKIINDNDFHIMITFDDGDCGLYRYLLPIIRRSYLPVTVFIITGYIGENQSWDIFSSSRHLNWDEIYELKDAGFEFGSHSVHHYDLTRLGLDEVKKELSESKRLIEERLGECLGVVYPFDRVNERVVKTAREVGYRVGFGSKEIIPLSLRRERIFRTDNLKSFKVKIQPEESLLLRWERFKAKVINLFSMAAMKR
ncbi:MAG TPA: polysaccharide deacetylase family protein [bacterium (Candidatus Stahlbacteria)]|nr:polysaccharide deacetylase family protein [Candidatus Stahlbacteria bacterium]